MTRCDSQRRYRASTANALAPPWRERYVGAEASERIRLVAKLDVRRTGPGAAGFAYRWQSAWENPILDSTIRSGTSAPVPLVTTCGPTPATQSSKCHRVFRMCKRACQYERRTGP